MCPQGQRKHRLLQRIGFKTYLLAGLVGLGVSGFGDSAKAQSQSEICRGLNTQLAALDLQPGNGGNAAKYRQYNNEIRKQEIQLNRDQRAARRYNCVGIFRRR